MKSPHGEALLGGTGTEVFSKNDFLVFGITRSSDRDTLERNVLVVSIQLGAVIDDHVCVSERFDKLTTSSVRFDNLSACFGIADHAAEQSAFGTVTDRPWRTQRVDFEVVQAEALQGADGTPAHGAEADYGRPQRSPEVPGLAL